MGIEIIYQNKPTVWKIHDLEVWLDEGIYCVGINEYIEYEDVGNLKKYYLKLLNSCKEHLENRYKCKGDVFYDDSSLDCRISLNKFGRYSIWFNSLEFLSLNELYNWVCKIIKEINYVK